nr:YaaC family protein [Chloroflexota bacterium]
LAYCSTIGYQYGLAGLGQTRIVPSLAAVAMNQPTQEAWTLLAIPSFDKVDATTYLRQQLLGVYEEVTLPTHLSHTVFGLNAFAYLNHRFFQTITPDTFLPSGTLKLGEVASRLTTGLRPYMGISPYDDGSNFQVVLPLGPTETPVTQDVAIYAVMFYLSSLVRYRPAYLEELLGHKPAWLIESFVNSTPETFLRIIVSRITNNRVLYRRG